MAVTTAISLNAQVNSTMVSARFDKNSFVGQKAKPAVGTKAEGDVLYSNNFSTASDWTMTAGPNHTSGDWQIVNALTPSLVSQAPSYGFPAAMLSTSGAPFALVDSDAAGSGEVQNAELTTTNGIDVAAALSTNGSAANAALYLEFTEIYRHYQESFFVEISNDNGANWTQFQVNPPAEVPVNTNSGNPEVETINITSAIGMGNWGSQVKIRFRYQGTYDWFWGVDDVKLLEAYNNDIKVSTFFISTPVGTTQELDYFVVPESQTSFPGLTFGANIFNKGAANQPDVALNATDGGTYDETGTTVAINSGAVDSVSVTVPYMFPSAVGNYPVAVSTDMANTDADPANNVANYTFRRDQYAYGRDNGVAEGTINQVTSQGGTDPFQIGNLMEIFDDMEVSNVQIRITNTNSNAIGLPFNGIIYKYNAGTQEFDYFAQTDDHEITATDLNSTVVLPISGGSFTTLAGDLLLVCAHHYGNSSTPIVGFGYAQSTGEGTVLGFTSDDGDPSLLFNLSSPNAIMIRLSDAPVGLEENALNATVNVFPNPAADKATVSFEVEDVQNATIVVTDLSGKVVNNIEVSSVLSGTNKVEINTANLAAGAYNVSLQANGSSVTKKLIVRK